MNYHLASIVTGHRLVAMAVFKGLSLDFCRVRHLSDSPDAAERAAIGFVKLVIDKFGVTAAAIETPRVERGRPTLHAALIIQTLRRDAISLWQVETQNLLIAYGMPALQTRKILREIAKSIWPAFDSNPHADALRDAALVGLYVQSERLFLN